MKLIVQSKINEQNENVNLYNTDINLKKKKKMLKENYYEIETFIIYYLFDSTALPINNGVYY